MLKQHGWWLTAVPVLAAHWLVLEGLQGWESGGSRALPTASGPVFHTRSIVPPPTPAASAEPPSTPSAPAAAPHKAKPAPRHASETSASALPWATNPPETSAAQTDVAEDASLTETAPTDTERAQAPAPAPTAPATHPLLPAAETVPPPRQDPLLQAMSIVRPGAVAAEGDGLRNSAPPPVRLPPPTQLQFDVTGQVRLLHYRARAELVWQHDGERYQAQQSISALFVGSRSQRSTGRIGAQGLLPERFLDKSRNEQAAHFDPAQGKATFSANTPDAAIGPGAQDRLSVFIQLGALLAAAPENYPPGTQIHLTTVGARNADRWAFVVEGPETLELRAGTLAALKLLRMPQRDYDQKAELWLAPSLGYLPVRIRLSQSNGDFADLQLEGHQPP